MIDFFYLSIYIIICIIGYLLIFIPHDLFNFLFEMKYNNITDYNDPKFTGGIHYEFNPLRHFKFY
jgi:hypothetical protein